MNVNPLIQKIAEDGDKMARSLNTLLGTGVGAYTGYTYATAAGLTGIQAASVVIMNAVVVGGAFYGISAGIQDTFGLFQKKESGFKFEPAL
jgi:hypothetical protein